MKKESSSYLVLFCALMVAKQKNSRFEEAITFAPVTMMSPSRPNGISSSVSGLTTFAAIMGRHWPIVPILLPICLTFLISTSGTLADATGDIPAAHAQIRKSLAAKSTPLDALKSLVHKAEQAGQFYGSMESRRAPAK